MIPTCTCFELQAFVQLLTKTILDRTGTTVCKGKFLHCFLYQLTSLEDCMYIFALRRMGNLFGQKIFTDFTVVVGPPN